MNIRAAIVGPTGYTGLFLIRLLLGHPHVELTYLASRREEQPNIAEEFPQLVGMCEMMCRGIDPEAIAEVSDVVFMCLPHKTAMQYVPAMMDAGLRVVDFSADYRFNDIELYEEVYGLAHTDPENFEQSVYGLPELFVESIAEADLVANPGCYPTAAVLGIAPLLSRGLVKGSGMVVNAVSGVSGVGRSAKSAFHFPEMNESFFAYNVGSHRHQPEIAQILEEVNESSVSLLFVPHVGPFDQGILSTIYLEGCDEGVSEDELFEAFEEAYDDEPFIRLRTGMPNVKHVRDTNFCDITVRVSGGKVVVVSAIDNMVKGASGQAVQNMNVMYGLEQTEGLL